MISGGVKIAASLFGREMDEGIDAGLEKRWRQPARQRRVEDTRDRGR
jgi:hypothetical protein